MTERTLKKSILAASTLLLALGQVSAHRPGAGSLPQTGIIEQCDFPGVDGLFITNSKFPYSNASLACESHGGALADITNQNYLLGADMVLTCIGPNSKAWIGSWDYRDISADPSEGVYDCLSLAVGNIGPGGGVDKTCTGTIPVLCQKQPSVVQHNPHYSEPVWSYSQGPVPTIAPVPGQVDAEDEEIFPVLYPNFNGGIYRPAAPLEVEEDQGNPVFYPAPGGVWGNSHPVRQPSPNHYNGHYKKPVGYIHEGPNGGFPGGVYPGGSGFGVNGYPYRYPNQYGGDEDCETVTVDGTVTTITHDSTPSATVVI